MGSLRLNVVIGAIGRMFDGDTKRHFDGVVTTSCGLSVYQSHHQLLVFRREHAAVVMRSDIPSAVLPEFFA